MSNAEPNYFKDNRNGTITHTRNNLIWQQKPGTQKMNWSKAMEYVKNLRLAGYTNWRLPTRSDFTVLLTGHFHGMDISNGALPPYKWLKSNGFLDIQLDYYWTSEIYSTDRNYAGIVCLLSAYTGYFHKSYEYYVIAVRDGQ